MTRLSIADARRRGQGSAHLDADPTYARWIMRRLSPAVSAAVVNFTSLSADSVTALSILAGILGALALLPGTWVFNLAAVLLLQLAYLCDVADGEVARIRGTAGLRGTYLDLIGHVLQNRALLGAGCFLLIEVTGAAWWAIAVSFAGLALAAPFGLQARQQVVRASAPQAETAHGRVQLPPWSTLSGSGARVEWVYRRISFIWNYPASMNLFCLAALVDAIRLLGQQEARPLVVPALAGLFALTLAAKQTANALRLLRRGLWEGA